MNSGCKKLNERYKLGDITQAELERAARNANIDLETAPDNVHQSAKQSRESGDTMKM
jgi:hypothetical protein